MEVKCTKEIEDNMQIVSDTAYRNTTNLFDIYDRNVEYKNKIMISQKQFNTVINFTNVYNYLTLEDLCVDSNRYTNFSPRKFFNVISFLNTYLGCAEVFRYNGQLYAFDFSRDEVSIRKTQAITYTRNIPDLTNIDDRFLFVGV